MYMMALLPVFCIVMIVWKVCCLVTFFFEEYDCDKEEDKYSLEHDTSDEESLMFDEDVDEDSWTVMENPIYDMSKEENNKPESFESFIDNPIYELPDEGVLSL